MSGELQDQERSKEKATGVRRRARSAFNLAVCLAAVVGLGWLARDIWDKGPARQKVRQLQSGDVDERQSAARALGQPLPREVPITAPALAAALSDTDAGVREEAARALAAAAASAPDAPEVLAAIQPLARALGDSAVAVRRAAAGSLGWLGKQVRIEPPPELIAALRSDGSEDVRAAAAAALGMFRGGHDVTVPALLEGIEDDSMGVRAACDAALAGGAFVLSPTTVSAVIRELELGSDARARLRAATVLGVVGARSGDDSVARALIAALQAPPGPAPRPLHDAPPSPSRGGPRGVRLSGAIGSADERPLTWDPACEAAQALARVAPRWGRGGEAVAALTAALRSPQPWRREAAAEGLFRLGKEAAPAAPALAAALAASVAAERSGGEPNSWAARALGEAAPGTSAEPAAVEALTAALASKGSGTRGYSVEALGRVTRAKADVVPHLRGLVNDRDRFVASKAREALARIEPAKDKTGTQGP